MSARERLIAYCKIDTKSDPDSGTHPSAAKEFDLANILVKQLRELGLEDAAVDAHCYVYAHLAGNVQKDVEPIGFIAHMDTAPDFTGTNVNPRIIENFDGKDIVLGNGVVTRMADFPQMPALKGKTLLVTDGSTLLGADDKAGIACIMEALSFWKAHPEAPHGPIAVAFTPDEEIGEGPLYFDVQKFGAAFAYTMDGDTISVVADETFHAVRAQVTCTGFSIHPGEAKNKMINAAAAAALFQATLPDYLTPEHTEGREGFIHLVGMEGNCEKAVLEYILRDHDAARIACYKELMEAAAALVNASRGAGVVTVSFTEQYRNMKEIMRDHPEVTQLAWRALENLGVHPELVPIRGGTDGAQLSFMGLPCPNLGAGGGNFHGRYEYCVLEELDMAVELIKEIARLQAVGNGR